MLKQTSRITAMYLGILCFALVTLVDANTLSKTEALSESLFVSARQSIWQGNFRQAKNLLSEAINAYDASHNVGGAIDARIQLGEVYFTLGLWNDSIQVLQKAETLATGSDNRSRLCQITGALAKPLQAIGDPASARIYLDKSMALAVELQDKHLQAVGSNNLGNLLFSEAKYAEASQIYGQAAGLCDAQKHPLLAAQIDINQVRTSAQIKDSAAALRHATLAKKALDESPDNHDKTLALINLGKLLLDLSPQVSDIKLQAFILTMLQQAAWLADQLGDEPAMVAAWGYLGRLYELTGQIETALQYTRKALFLAQSRLIAGAQYRWEWQLGRILKQQHKIDAAIQAYRRAIFDAEKVRRTNSGGELFHESAGRLFFDYAALLLERSDSTDDAQQSQLDLITARDAVERFKSAELEDYFQDDCVTAFQTRITPLDRIGGTTGILYPILFPEQTILLLSLPDGLRKITVPVSRVDLTTEIRALRAKLEKRTTWAFLPHARQLHRWLIDPLEPILAEYNIDTLVIVPDGPLRTIPLSTLYDGTRFLIQRYAIATTPGLTLTDARPIERKQIRILLGGLTKSVQNFPPLVYVQDELDSIERLYNTVRLQDAAFLSSRIERELADTPYSIVHIASHGEFKGNADQSFVLTYDGKLTMNQIERDIGRTKFRHKPVELLTLSACQTAAGDDRAALGLAGAAIKSGARSVLASLWFINDQASSQLVSVFYRQLSNPGMSKARALQQAQLQLLQNPRYEHPGYWSPFLLIGNWL